MFNQHRQEQFQVYQHAASVLIADPDRLIALERIVTATVASRLASAFGEIKKDYDEASYLYPFWQNYPPRQRGRMPIGDQVPWIEVGEHAVGDKLQGLLELDFDVKSIGIPTGPDVRFVIKSEAISVATKGLTDSCWLFVDIKSAGPRDDASHAVMSHNQISGSGEWTDIDSGVRNRVMTATGMKASHPFYCSIPPVYVLSDRTILPVVNIALKPTYSMLSILPLEAGTPQMQGQPLSRIDLAAIPNGLLLEKSPGYLQTHPSLLFPGKDDKGKHPQSIRARVSFEVLKTIDAWRVLRIE